MAALGLPALPARMAVAISGGADSMALARLAAEWAKAEGVQLHALTVDHGLRPEAAEEARRVTAWMSACGLPCVTLMPQTPICGANIQEKARHARYQAMARWGEAHGVGHLLIAHHADDQLETVLLRLIRAAGVEGLAGMRPVSENYGLTLLRPLLTVPKERLQETLRTLGQPWIEDPSNRSQAYARNRLRPVAEALRAEGLSAERTALLTAQLAATADYIHTQTETWMQEHVVFEENTAHMPLDAWQDVPHEIGWRALRALIRRVGASSKHLRSENILPLFHALAAGELTKARTLGGVIVRPDEKRNRLNITPET